jgi:flagellar FliJ protein
MPRRFHLQPLLDLTQNHTDVAARRLNQLKGKWNDAEEKLGQLIAFREEYRQRYQNAASHGMSMTVLREYQVFLGKLEAAVTQQTDEVVQCHKRWEMGQQAWHMQKLKLSAYDMLSKRHHQGELRRESKIEQREQDEFAAQAVTRKIKKQEEDG